jgi:hypothetical protein
LIICHSFTYRATLAQREGAIAAPARLCSRHSMTFPVANYPCVPGGAPRRRRKLEAHQAIRPSRWPQIPLCSFSICAATAPHFPGARINRLLLSFGSHKGP